jgi:hypothetical protein
MPVLRPSGSDFTSFVKAAAQYVPAGAAAKPSKSGGVSVAKPGLGAVIRTSQVGALASPTTSAVIINGVTAPAPPSGPPPDEYTLLSYAAVQAYQTSLFAANASATASWTSTTSTASNVGGVCVLAPNGLIYGVPQFGTKLLYTFNPSNSVVSSNVCSSSNISAYYNSSVLTPQGKIYCFSTATPTVVVFNYVTSEYYTLTTLPSKLDVLGVILAPNGKIYGFPMSTTNSNVCTIDPVTDAITYYPIATGVGIGRYGWPINGPNGNIYVSSAYGNSNVMVFNTTTNTFVRNVAISGYYQFFAHPNGNFYGTTPFGMLQAAFSNVAILNTTTNTVSYVPLTQAGHRPILGPDGNLYGFPVSNVNNSTSSNVIKFNVSDSTVTYLSPTTLLPLYYTPVLYTDGNVYSIHSTGFVKLTFSGLGQLPSSNYCLSPYINTAAS